MIIGCHSSDDQSTPLSRPAADPAESAPAESEV